MHEDKLIALGLDHLFKSYVHCTGGTKELCFVPVETVGPF
jgi:hypothetical protein